MPSLFTAVTSRFRRKPEVPPEFRKAVSSNKTNYKTISTSREAGMGAM